MKPLVKYLLICVGVVVVLALAAPFLLPANVYKGPLEKAVEQATGRSLTISGDLRLQFLPRIVIEVEDAELANVPGASSPTFARMERLIVGVNPMALLRREVEITRFVLERPEINLELAENGVANWELVPPGRSPEPTGEGDSATSVSDEISNITLGDVRLIDGRFTYSNHQTGEAYAFSDVNMTLSLASLDSPFRAQGSLTYKDEPVEIALGIDQLQALTTDQETPISLDVSSQAIDLTLEGSYRGGAASKIGGKVDLQVPSLKRLNAWIGSSFEGGTVPDTLFLRGDLSAQGSVYGFENATLKFDDMTGTGSLRVKTGGKVPALSGRLDVDTIDLRPYMPETLEDAEGTQSSQASGWSPEVIDLTGLRSANASLELTAKAFRIFDYEIGTSAMTVTLKNGILQADLTRLDLYKGLGVGSVKIDASRAIPQIEARFDLANVEAEPLVLAATAKKLVTGTGNFTLDVKTSGRSQKEWMERLAGGGKLFLNDGELIGVDLTRMVAIVGSLTGYQPAGERKEGEVEGQVGETRSTEFVEMGGTFVIAAGVLNSQDFQLHNEIINLAGSGDVNLGRQKIDFRIDPDLSQEDGGLKLALKVKGPWDDISFRPDMQQILQQKLKEQLGVEDSSPIGQIFDLFTKKPAKQPSADE